MRAGTTSAATVLRFPPTVALRHHALIPPRRPFLDRLPSPRRRKRGLHPFVPSLSLPAATRLRWRWLRNGPRAPMSPTPTTTRGLASRRAPSRRASCGAHSSTPTRSRRTSLSSVISSHTTWSSWAPGRGSPEQPPSAGLRALSRWVASLNAGSAKAASGSSRSRAAGASPLRTSTRRRGPSTHPFRRRRLSDPREDGPRLLGQCARPPTKALPPSASRRNVVACTPTSYR